MQCLASRALKGLPGLLLPTKTEGAGCDAVKLQRERQHEQHQHQLHEQHQARERTCLEVLSLGYDKAFQTPLFVKNDVLITMGRLLAACGVFSERQLRALSDLQMFALGLPMPLVHSLRAIVGSASERPHSTPFMTRVKASCSGPPQSPSSRKGALTAWARARKVAPRAPTPVTAPASPEPPVSLKDWAQSRIKPIKTTALATSARKRPCPDAPQATTPTTPNSPAKGNISPLHKRQRHSLDALVTAATSLSRAEAQGPAADLPSKLIGCGSNPAAAAAAAQNSSAFLRRVAWA